MLKLTVKKDQRDKKWHVGFLQEYGKEIIKIIRDWKKKFLLETITYAHKTIKKGSDLGKFLRRISFSEDTVRSIVVGVAAAALGA